MVLQLYKSDKADASNSEDKNLLVKLVLSVIKKERKKERKNKKEKSSCLYTGKKLQNENYTTIVANFTVRN